MSKLEFEGVPLKLRSKVYVCPALGLGLIRNFKDDISVLNQGIPAATGENPGDRMLDFSERVIRVVHAALSMNYPDLAPEEVAAGVTLGNMSHVCMIVLGISGFKEIDDEAAAEGALKEQKSVGESTGTQ